MKKATIFAFIAMATIFASCGNSTKTETQATSTDSTQVQADTTKAPHADSTVKDTTASVKH